MANTTVEKSTTMEKLSKYSVVISLISTALCIICVLVFVLKQDRIDKSNAQMVSDAVKKGIDQVILPYKEENKLLEVRNDSLISVIDVMKKSDSVILAGMRKNDDDINQLNQLYNEKKSAVDRYNFNDINEFLSDRYGK